MAGKRFPEDFDRIDKIKTTDKLLINDSKDGVDKYVTASQFYALLQEQFKNSVEETIEGFTDDVASQLTELSEEIYGSSGIDTIYVTTQPTYQAVQLPTIIKKGHTILSVEGVVVWLGRTNNAELNLTSQTLPYVATEDYAWVFSDRAQDLAIVVDNGGSNVTGLLEKVNDIATDVENIKVDLYGENHDYVNKVYAEGSYAKTELPIPIKKGHIVVSVIGQTVWLGNDVAEIELTSLTLPYEVTKDYTAIFSYHSEEITIIANDGEQNVNGLVDEVTQLSEDIRSFEGYAEDLLILDNKVNDVYGEPIKTLSVNSASQSYQEVLFDEIIPKGTTIDYIAKSAKGAIYLTKNDGSFVAEDSVNNLVARTPYTTEYDIRGYKASGLNCGFFFMFHPSIGVLQMRRSLNVTRNMSQLDIVKLMVVAFQVGNLDIIFETGTYEFDGTITEFLVNNLGYDVNYGCGIPIGNNCRYFFNGSVLKFTNTYAPKQSNCFDTKLIGSSFEMHDAYIECDGYYYAIHDESNASSIPYRHLYQNIRIKGNNYGFGPLGIGTGFNTTLDFDGVVCDADSWVMHGPTNNPYNDSAKLILSVKNSYFGIPLSISSYDKERDSVEIRLFNSTFPKGISASIAEVAKEYITFNVVVM